MEKQLRSPSPTPSPPTLTVSSSRWLRVIRQLTRRQTVQRCYLWLTQWLRIIVRLLKLPVSLAKRLTVTLYAKSFSWSSTEPKTSQTASSSPSISEIANVSCPTCERYLEALRKQVLTKPSLSECLEMRSHFRSNGYKLYNQLLQRSRVEVLQNLEKDEGRKVYRTQGRLEQLRIMDQLPNEIEYLIFQYELEEKRQKELQHGNK
jgi:hypothetical protein